MIQLTLFEQKVRKLKLVRNSPKGKATVLCPKATFDLKIPSRIAYWEHVIIEDKPSDEQMTYELEQYLDNGHYGAEMYTAIALALKKVDRKRYERLVFEIMKKELKNNEE